MGLWSIFEVHLQEILLIMRETKYVLERIISDLYDIFNSKMKLLCDVLAFHQLWLSTEHHNNG